MGFDIMKEIKGLCKGCIDDEDWCIFIVAAILGFLLCMYIGKEPFIEGFGASLDEIEKNQPPANTETNQNDIGLQPKNRNVENIPPSLVQNYNVIQNNNSQNKQVNLANKQGMATINTATFKPFQGWDFHGYAPIDLVLDVKVISPDLSKGPMGPDRPLLDPSLDGPSKDVQNELKIILIYAAWCGHSKKMLPDYQKIESEFHGKVINNTKVSIEKYTDKDDIKEYKVNGFPTLFYVKDGNRLKLNERSYEGIKAHIMKHTQ